MHRGRLHGRGIDGGFSSNCSSREQLECNITLVTKQENANDGRRQAQYELLRLRRTGTADKGPMATLRVEKTMASRMRQTRAASQVAR